MNMSDHTATNVRVLRILAPINANDDSRWGVRYALRRRREGKKVEVILLNVGEPVDQWQVLRFRTQREIAMPMPRKGLPSLFSSGIVRAVKRQQRDIPVVAVNSDGMPPRYPGK